MLSLSIFLLFPSCDKQCRHNSSEIPPQAPMVRILNEICDSFQATGWSEPAGVFCQRQQQWQRQRCRGHQDRDQPGHTAVTSGKKASYNCRRCIRIFQPCSHIFSLQLQLSKALNMTSPASRALLPFPEQAELIAVRPRHGRGGLGPVGWLRRVLAGAAQVAGGGTGGTGSGPTHGPNAGGGGEADPAPQTLTCGWLG